MKLGGLLHGSFCSCLGRSSQKKVPGNRTRGSPGALLFKLIPGPRFKNLGSPWGLAQRNGIRYYSPLNRAYLHLTDPDLISEGRSVISDDSWKSVAFQETPYILCRSSLLFSRIIPLLRASKKTNCIPRLRHFRMLSNTFKHCPFRILSDIIKIATFRIQES